MASDEKHNDDREIAYLWDPTEPHVDADVAGVEKRLTALRFDPDLRRLPLPRRGRLWRMPPKRWLALAAAAVLLLTVSGFGFAQWRLAWPAGQAWTISTRPASAPAELAIGAPLVLPPSETALVDVARIGMMRVEGGSRLALRSTQGARHRLAMENGRLYVRVWAPPGSVSIQTPAGEVIDLGCEFDLEVVGTTSRVRVRSGWVQVANNIGESLVPAGASSEMTAMRAPGVAVFDNASASFRSAVRSYEQTQDIVAVDQIVSEARVEDMYTLLILVARDTPGIDRIASRAAELWPMPEGVTVAGIVRGDRNGLWRWRDTLHLPPPKGWIRNWRDGLPDWLHGNGR